MSTKQKQARSPSRAAKKARFTERQAKKTKGASPLVLIVGIAVALALIGGTVLALTRPSEAVTASPDSAAGAEVTTAQNDSQILSVKAATHGHEPYPLAVAEGDVVRLPLSQFDDYKAHYYSYVHEGHPVEFFVLKSKDGVVRAAFNACDVCFQSKKGYSQDGDYMVCNNCGRRFPADQINVIQGGCNPAPLRRAAEGDTLIIQVEDIIPGQNYF